MAVGDGPHDGAHGEAVEIVVDEDQDAQQEGGEGSAHLGLDVLGGPAAEGGGAAGGVYQRHNDAQKDKEQEDTGVVFDGGHQTVVDNHVQRADGGKALREQSAYRDADEQRAVRLLGDKGQSDGDDGGHQCPERTVHAVGGCAVLNSQSADTQQRGGGHDQQGRPQ